MKTVKYIILVLLISFISCEKKSDPAQYLNLLESVNTSKYYPNEIFIPQYAEIYGTWKVTGTSGGIAGTGYTPDFEYLIVKHNGIFGIIRGDSLLTTGKIEIINQTNDELFIDIIPEDENQNNNIEILSDSEKYIFIQNDSLSMIAPCCDRYNTILKRY